MAPAALSDVGVGVHAYLIDIVHHQLVHDATGGLELLDVETEGDRRCAVKRLLHWVVGRGVIGVFVLNFLLDRLQEISLIVVK